MQGNIISKPLTCSLSQAGVNVKRPHEEDMSPELLNLIPGASSVLIDTNNNKNIGLWQAPIKTSYH